MAIYRMIAKVLLMLVLVASSMNFKETTLVSKNDEKRHSVVYFADAASDNDNEDQEEEQEEEQDEGEEEQQEGEKSNDDDDDDNNNKNESELDQVSSPARERVKREGKKAMEKAIDREFSIADKDNNALINRVEFGATSSSDIGFWAAFINSVAMIIVTELGDKTFFIAAIMAMKHPRYVVYAGAMGALALMTVLSAGIGYALPQLLPAIYTHYASIILFAFFGYKLLMEAYEMYTTPSHAKNEELEEVEAELNAKNGGIDVESGQAAKSAVRLAVLMQAFTMTFVAEWGDRSQIATIALASSKDPIGVTIGGTLGHAMCTGLAVVGGRMLATRISERQVALAGGILFFVFALHSLYMGPP